MANLTLTQIVDKIASNPKVCGFEPVFVKLPGDQVARTVNLDLTLWRRDHGAVCLSPSQSNFATSAVDLVNYLREQIGETVFSSKGNCMALKGDHKLMICKHGSIDANQVTGVMVREGKVHLTVTDMSKNWM